MFSQADPARLAQLEKAIKRDSSNEKALLEAGHLYLAEQRLDEAARVTIRALRLDPNTAEGHAHLAVLLMAEASTQQDRDSARRAVDGALEAVNRALQINPELPEGWLFKGMILMAGRQDLKAAAQVWEQYLKIAPPGADTTRIHAMVEAASRSGS
jgi:tetratricopeptide (TPR) repeat protein